MTRLLAFVLAQRLLVLAVAGLLVAVGVWSALRLPIDAIRDVTNVQVQINTDAPALSPLEAERQITLPIELAMAGLPDVEEVRSLSKFGLSQVTVLFKDHVNIFFARQLVQERLQHAREQIPPGFGTPEMGPITTGLGEIFLYTIEAPSRDLTELRTLQDWVVKPQLRGVPGVAEINTFGGLEKQYQVLVRPEALVKYHVTLRQVFEALAASNVNKGGGYMVKGAEQYVIRGVGQLQDAAQIQNIVVTSAGGVPVRIRDLAEVAIGAAIRQGAATKDGQGESVMGVVMMLMGANARVVVDDVKTRFEQIRKSLPDGVTINTFYDRTDLVARTIRTVEVNLESIQHTTLVERELREAFPSEIATIASKTGRPEIATDPMGVNISDVIVMLHPPDRWKRARTKAELEAEMARVLNRIPGLAYTFSQPIELRVNEMIAGVRSDLAIKIFGDDLDVLRRKADEVLGAVGRLEGASGFTAQQVTGLPMLQVVVQPDRIARYGISAADVMSVVETLGGVEATQILEGQRRFPLVLRFHESVRRDRDSIGAILVSAPGGERVPLASLARVEEVESPAEISHVNGSRLIVVEGNVGAAGAAWADCSARVANAQSAIKDAEAAVTKAKESGKAAAKGPLAKARKQLLHAEAECKTEGAKNVRKNAESGREAREAQGYAEEARMLAEKL